ncbi:MAG: hypothetical protein R2878_12895 [Thermoleophilia bacterium]
MSADMDATTDAPQEGTDLRDVLAAEPASGSRFRDAVMDHPRRLVVPVVIGLVLGLLVGLIRSPDYTAETRLAVARVDVPTQALPGFATGVESLAVTYSRLVNAEDVIQATASAVSRKPDDLRSSITGSPIPNSPLFRIEASGGSAEDAVKTANAAAESLRGYVASLNTDISDSERIFGMYKLAARDRVTAERRVRARQLLVRQDNSPDNVRALAAARASLAGAQLRETAIKELYQQSLVGIASANIVQVVNAAQSADSDRGRAVRRLALTGLLIGLAIGVLLVLFLPTQEVSTYQPKHART